MAEITNIACRRLHPHPDNPRKELGDLTELAASIKENGIFQNLTVIPGHYLNSREYIAKCVDEGGDAAAAAAAWTPKAVWSSDDYTIIIGHRRAAAAQQAGLFEVPCVVVEMDEREQLQTMMIENMQRSDLTTYEQAQGFQLMLDLGDTVEQVASKSGFSQSTIRRRVKLLSLDRDAFRRAELRGATLSDYAELDKIESVEDKNKALEALGTQNFRRVMQEVLENQKWEHRKAEWIADLKKFAIEDPNATYQTHEHVTGYSKWNITKDVVVPEDADHDPVVFDYDENGIRHLREVKLWEISVVTWAMNEQAVITDHKSDDAATRIEAEAQAIVTEVKAGRKISASRMKSLKDACTSMKTATKLLDKIISEAQGDNGKGHPPVSAHKSVERKSAPKKTVEIIF